MACKNIVTERGGDMSVTRNGRCIYTNLTFWLQLEDNSSVDLVSDSQLELSTRSQLWSQTWWIGLELRHKLDQSWTGVGMELATVKPSNGVVAEEELWLCHLLLRLPAHPFLGTLQCSNTFLLAHPNKKGYKMSLGNNTAHAYDYQAIILPLYHIWVLAPMTSI